MPQQFFEWDWPATRRVSRALRFPDFVEVTEGSQVKRVASSILRSVMAVIEDHAGVKSWSTVSNETLWVEASVRPTHGKRALRYLDAEGFLIRVTRYVDGQKVRSMRPNWQHYLDSDLSSLTVSEKEDLLCELSGELPRPKVPEQKAEDPEQRPKVPERRPEDPERKAEAPPEGPRSRSISRVRNLRPINRSRADDRVIGLKFSEEETAQAYEWTDRISSAVDMEPKGDFTMRQNWEVAAKFAVLTVRRSIPEAYLAMALETIRNGGKAVSIAYLIAIIRNRCRESGEDLGVLLKSVVLPPELRWQAEEAVK